MLSSSGGVHMYTEIRLNDVDIKEAIAAYITKRTGDIPELSNINIDYDQEVGAFGSKALYKAWVIIEKY